LCVFCVLNIKGGKCFTEKLKENITFVEIWTTKRIGALSDFGRSTVIDITYIMDKTALQQASRLMLDRDRFASHRGLWWVSLFYVKSVIWENLVRSKVIWRSDIYDLSLHGSHCFKLTLNIRVNFSFYRVIFSFIILRWKAFCSQVN
jgi:hypothetical protein